MAPSSSACRKYWGMTWRADVEGGVNRAELDAGLGGGREEDEGLGSLRFRGVWLLFCPLVVSLLPLASFFSPLLF